MKLFDDILVCASVISLGTIAYVSYRGGGTQPVQANTPAPIVSAPTNDWDVAIRFVQKWEGDGAASRYDLGGKTRFGVTESLWKGLGVPEPQSKESAAAIFRRIYWDGGPRCSQYPAPLNATCLDTAVNLGPHGNGATNQGWASLSAGLNLKDPIAASKSLVQRRLDWRNTMVARRPEQRIHLQGWQNRDRDLERQFLGGNRAN